MLPFIYILFLLLLRKYEKGDYKYEKENKYSCYFLVLLLEIIYIIIIFILWSDKLHDFFLQFSIYNRCQEVFLFTVLFLLSLILVLVNLPILKFKKNSIKNLKLPAVVYIGLILLSLYGKRSLYVEAQLEDNNERKNFIIGYYDGEYALASAETDTNVISFSNKNVQRVEKNKIKKFENHYFRKEIFK